MSRPVPDVTPDSEGEWSGVESTDGDVGAPPVPNENPASDQAATKPETAKKRSRWQAWPELFVVGGLLAVLAELVGFGLLGWLWWLVANAALAVLLFLVALAWRGKLGKLWRARRGAGRTGGAGGGRWPGRKAGPSSRGGLLGGTAGSPPRRGLLGALGAGRRAGRGGGVRGTRAGGRTGGRSRGGLLGALGAGRRASRGGAAGTAGGSRGRGSRAGVGSAARGVFGGKRRGSGKGSGGASPGAGLMKPFIGGVKKGAAEAGKHKTPAPAAGKKPAAGAGPGEPPVSTSGKGGPDADGTGWDVTTEPEEKGKPVAIDFTEDQSLQRWGRNLHGLEEYGDEVAALYRQAEEAAETYRQAAAKIRDQASSELPASPRLLAEVEGVTERAQRAASADDWKAVAADAGVLPGLYRMEHETDEDRLDNPRGSQQAEMRADVTTAVQDN